MRTRGGVQKKIGTTTKKPRSPRAEGAAGDRSEELRLGTGSPSGIGSPEHWLRWFGAFPPLWHRQYTEAPGANEESPSDVPCHVYWYIPRIW
eukprot:COSAG02_NODE_898_length_16108_cov_5.877444_16_plen_92_part_00